MVRWGISNVSGRAAGNFEDWVLLFTDPLPITKKVSLREASATKQSHSSRSFADAQDEIYLTPSTMAWAYFVSIFESVGRGWYGV